MLPPPAAIRALPRHKNAAPQHLYRIGRDGSLRAFQVEAEALAGNAFIIEIRHFPHNNMDCERSNERTRRSS